jgi:hypothetical protein
MSIIVCKKAPSVNPYVVKAINMVKGCPIHKTIEREKCRECESHVRERD